MTTTGAIVLGLMCLLVIVYVSDASVVPGQANPHADPKGKAKCNSKKNCNPCYGVDCGNQGTCSEGICNCAPGYSGDRCTMITATVCENNSGTLSCPTGTIHIHAAFYGRERPDSEVCPYGRPHIDATDCHKDVATHSSVTACEGTTSCSVASNNGAFTDPCYGTYKYLEIKYTCE